MFKINSTNTNIIIFKIFFGIIINHFRNNYNLNTNLDILKYEKILNFEEANFYNDLNMTEGIYNDLKEELSEEQQNLKNEENYSNEESTQALDYEVNEDDDSELGEGEELIQDLD